MMLVLQDPACAAAESGLPAVPETDRQACRESAEIMCKCVYITQIAKPNLLHTLLLLAIFRDSQSSWCGVAQQVKHAST